MSGADGKYARQSRLIEKWKWLRLSLWEGIGSAGGQQARLLGRVLGTAVSIHETEISVPIFDSVSGLPESLVAIDWTALKVGILAAEPRR